MNQEKYKEMQTELGFLNSDIKDEHCMYAECLKNHRIVQHINFYKIEDPDTLLTLANFLSIQELKVQIKPMKYEDGTPGIKVKMW